MSLNLNASNEPYWSWTIAFMVRLTGRVCRDGVSCVDSGAVPCGEDVFMMSVPRCRFH